MESQYNPYGEQVHFEPRDVHAEAIRTFLVAADALSHAGDMSQAELRYKQALRQAELAFGESSDHYKRVLSLMSVFFRKFGRDFEARQLEIQLLKMSPDDGTAQVEQPAESSGLQSRFIKKKVTSEQLVAMTRVVFPPEVKRACHALGMSTEEEFTTEDVLKAWKKTIVEGSIHPDLGGPEEHAILLNTSKDVLIRYQESRLPKLRLGRHTESLQAR